MMINSEPVLEIQVLNVFTNVIVFEFLIKRPVRLLSEWLTMDKPWKIRAIEQERETYKRAINCEVSYQTANENWTENWTDRLQNSKTKT